MKQKNSIVETILGSSDEDFSLSNQIFNAVTFSGILICLLLFLVDSIMGIGQGNRIPAVGIFIVLAFIWMYGKSREHGSFRDYTKLYIAIGFFLLLQTWYLRGGSTGVSLLVLVYFLVTISMILSGTQKYVCITLSFIFVTGLFVTEFRIPELIPYPSREDLLVDVYIYMMLICPGIIVCVFLIMQNYEIQYQRVREINLSLDQSKKELENIISQQKKSQEIIQKTLEEKELLLREIHHRVKNNLQVISSLLLLQKNKLDNLEVLDALNQAGNRVQAIALVHELLYQSDTIAEIHFHSYLEKLVGQLSDMFDEPSRVQVKIESNNIHLAIGHSITSGLIITELISNSFKYAFPGERMGLIDVSLRQLNAEYYELVIGDDGIGFQEDFDWENTTTLGLMLVRELVEGQLGGNLRVEGENGLRWVITWPKDIEGTEEGRYYE